MPQGPNAPYTKLDQNHILQRVFDENDDTLRVDATVTATIGTVECIINAASGDNIAITSQDGSKTLEPNVDGSLNAVVTATDLDIRNLVFATDKVDVTGSLITVSAVDLDIRNLVFATDKVDVTGSSVSIDNFPAAQVVDQGTSPWVVSTTNGALDSTLVLTNTKLDTLITTVQNQEPMQISGTDDGTVSGTEYGFVNNLKLQILAAADRDEQYTYADFGTKDERITLVEYSSPTFSGFTVRRDFNYTLIGTKYRRDSSIWSIV